jgi:hypothetical protein
LGSLLLDRGLDEVLDLEGVGLLGVGLVGVLGGRPHVQQAEVQLLEPDLLGELGHLRVVGVHLRDRVGRGQVLAAALLGQKVEQLGRGLGEGALHIGVDRFVVRAGLDLAQQRVALERVVAPEGRVDDRVQEAIPVHLDQARGLLLQLLPLGRAVERRGRGAECVVPLLVLEESPAVLERADPRAWTLSLSGGAKSATTTEFPAAS